MIRPSYRSISSLYNVANTQVVSVRAGAVASGDLLLYLAWKNVSSNFTFPQSFAPMTEVASLGVAGNVAWRWALDTDSGASFVCSAGAAGGAGSVFCGTLISLTNVVSVASPLQGFALRVGSSQWVASNSLQVTDGFEYALNAIMHADNVVTSLSGFTAGSWAAVSSHTTSTGSDAALTVFEQTAASSGAWLLPSSGRPTTSQRWLAATFGVIGEAYTPQVFTETAEDLLSVIDSINRFCVLWRVVQDSGLLTVLDGGEVRRLLTLVAEDELDLVDSVASTVVEGGGSGGTVVTRTAQDTLLLTDALVRIATRIRAAGDALTVTDELRMARDLRRSVTDALVIADQALRRAIRNRVAADAIAVADSATRAVLRAALVTDTLTVADALVALRRLTRTGQDTLTLFDEFYRQGSQSKVATDALALADGTLAALRSVRVAGDTLLPTDGALGVAVRNRLATDVLTADDKAVVLRFLTRGDTLTVTDGLQAARVLGRALTDTLLLGDSLQSVFSGGVRVKVAEDTITVSDGAVVVRVLRRVVGDTVVLSDGTLSTMAGQAVLRTLSDALTVTDDTGRAVVRNRVMQSLLAALASDAVRSPVRGRVASDALTVQDLALRTLARTMVLSDTLALQDNGQLTGRISVRALSSVLELSDGFTKQFFDALAGVLDVHIRISAMRNPVVLGQAPVILLGVAPGPVLGGYN